MKTNAKQDNGSTNGYIMTDTEENFLKEIPENCVILEIGSTGIGKILNAQRGDCQVNNKLIQFCPKQNEDGAVLPWLETLGK